MPICDNCGAIGGYHHPNCGLKADSATNKNFKDGQQVWYIPERVYVTIKEARAGGLTVQDATGDIFQATFEEVRA